LYVDDSREWHTRNSENPITETDALAILNEILKAMQLWITDSDGAVIMLDYWADIVTPGMPVTFSARTGARSKGAAPGKTIAKEESRWADAITQMSRLFRR
jgi:hypothetical protein